MDVDREFARLVREWLKGCTCAPAARPQECERCTAAFLSALLDRARKCGVPVGGNAIGEG